MLDVEFKAELFEEHDLDCPFPLPPLPLLSLIISFAEWHILEAFSNGFARIDFF